MTRDLAVPKALYLEVDKALAELTATLAGYNLVSRFLIAMRNH